MPDEPHICPVFIANRPFNVSRILLMSQVWPSYHVRAMSRVS